MKKTILAPLFGALFFSILNANEQSVFGAGDLESLTPYGLTQSEQVLLKNKKNVDSLGQNVSTIEERIDGIRSVLDGTNERVSQINRRLRDLENARLTDKNRSTIDEELSKIRLYVNKTKKLQDTNNKKIQKVIQELSVLIDTINANYVSRDELNKFLIDGNVSIKKKLITKEPEKKKLSNKKNLTQIHSTTLALEARELYKQGKIDEAKEYYEVLIKRKYKPAFGNFMIGEIEYSKKSWSKAIVHYKKSAEIYEKASYMPKLLYHTAISFDKLNETENANKFYKALKLAYPDSKEAKASPDRK